MYEVVDLPIPNPRKGRLPKYPFADMNVGQSFIVPAIEASPTSLGTACYKQSLNGKRFRQAKLEDGSIQVWRES